MSRIGELLVREKMLSIQQLQQAQDEAKRTGRRLGATLARLGFVRDQELTQFVAPPSRRARPTSTSSPTRRSSASATASTACSRGDEPAAQAEERHRLAHQDHEPARHRRAPLAAGRPHQAQARQGQGDGLPRLGPAHALGREDRHASPRQVEPAARHDEARLRQKPLDDFKTAITSPTAWCSSRARRARARRRRSTRRSPTSTRSTRTSPPPKIPSSSTSRHQPGADARRHRPELRGGAALVPAAGPDIIMVGEIRDFETAEIAVKAALTGHLVLSTLHTNDAPSTVTRLLNMGIEPFLVTASVNLVVAQRLARKICADCKRPRSRRQAGLLDAGLHRGAASRRQGHEGAGLQDLQRHRLQGPRRALRGHALHRPAQGDGAPGRVHRRAQAPR
jgi:hypothetical protein